jgi:2-polyprenyl-3-methyl-5-hydroxy-6-metoxy-1,4-benzoquinol methylase
MYRAVSLPDFSSRISAPERMDDHSSSESDLYETLKHFSLINRLFSRTPALFRRIIFKDIKRRELKSVTIMDVGAGGGDFARWCVAFLKRSGLTCRVICVDNDPRAISYLRKTCAPYPQIQIIRGSAYEIDAVNGTIDYIVSSNMMHHFSDERVPGLIAGLFRKAQKGLLINDLERVRLAYFGFWLFAGIFMRTGFTLGDGLLSIRKGFTREELRGHIEKAGLAGRLRIGRAVVGKIYIVGTKK